jgi:hypothetical protein
MMMVTLHRVYMSQSAEPFRIDSSQSAQFFSEIHSRPSMRTTAGSFLNKLEYQMQMLNDKKTIKTRLFEKTELYGPAPYTHVLFRLVERIRRACAQHHVVMAMLAGRLGPFSSARAAVEAAALANGKLGISEDDLLKYMTRMRMIRSGQRKGATEEVIVPVVLYLLDDIHARDDIWWRKCEHDQAGFLPYQHTPNGAARRRRHFGYLYDNQSSSSSPRAASAYGRSAAVIASTPRAAPALSVPTVPTQPGAAAAGVGPLKAARCVFHALFRSGPHGFPHAP